jgi:hypothetical protein
MTLVDSLGFISSNLNLKCFRNSKIFILLLKDNSITRSLLINLIGEASKESSILSSPSLAFHITCPALMETSKMDSLNTNTDT